MIELGRATRLVAGAVGQPGERAFFLEVGTSEDTRWFLLEKDQVAALARQTMDLARRTGVEPASAPPELLPPVEVDFRIGEMQVGYDGGSFQFVLVPVDGEEVPEAVAFEADAGLVVAMATRALEVVAAGRPKCRKCGLPEDPAGHVCPSANGDLRRR